MRIVLVIIMYLTCSCEVDGSANSCVQSDVPVLPQQTMDSTIILRHGNKDVRVKISMEADFERNVVLLPGWNYPIEHWYDSTDIVTYAKERKLNLIMIESGKSIYQQAIYPETRMDWRDEITVGWILDTLIRELEESFQLLKTTQENYVLGISTGGRGAVLLACHAPELFSGVASLSGDFDQARFSYDNLYRGYYGAMDTFPRRYTGEENPMFWIKQLDMPIILVHGENDNVVPCAHSRHFHEALHAEHRNPKQVLLIVPQKGHNYEFWKEQLPKTLDRLIGFKQ